MLLSTLLLVLSYLTAVLGLPSPLSGPPAIHLHFYIGTGGQKAGNDYTGKGPIGNDYNGKGPAGNLWGVFL